MMTLVLADVMDHRFPARLLRERVRVRVSWGRGQVRLCVLCCYDEIGFSRCNGKYICMDVDEKFKLG